jgi:hypothetical protein
LTNRQAEQNLARSRNRFFHEEKLPQENFWFSWYNRLSSKPPVSDQDIAALQTWSPQRSNCPEQTCVVEDLIQDMPDEWRPLASELFRRPGLSRRGTGHSGAASCV